MTATGAEGKARRVVAPRGVVLLGAPAALTVWLPSPWAWVVTWAWLAAALVLLAVDRSRAASPDDLEWSRETPVKLSIGVENPTSLLVRNRGEHVARLVVRETPPARFAGERLAAPVALASRAEAVLPFRFTPPSRGLFSFGGPGVRSMGPLGLAGRHFTVPLREDVKVYPDITAVRRYALLARRGSLLEIGIKAARHAGAGTEFESLRDYQPGDDFRDIDWKATARRAAPVTRKFEAERSRTVVLALDAGRLMTPVVGGASKLDRAVNAALLLAFLATRADDFVGLMVFGRDVRTYLPPRKGHRQFLAVLEALYGVEGRLEEPDYAGALRYLAARQSKRSLIVLFTDLAGAEPSRRLLTVLATLSPRHLPLVVTQRNREVERLGFGPSATEADAFRASVAEGLLKDKASALKVLASHGALALDVHPEELSVAAVNRYLELKARGRL